MAFRLFPYSARALAFFTGLLFLILANTAHAAPNAPSNIRGLVVNSTTIAMIWDDNSTDETGFDVEISVNGGALQSVTVPANQNSVQLTVGTNATYACKVRSYIGSPTTNPSGYSNTITLATVTFGLPGDTLAVNRSDGTVFLAWSDNAYSENGYFIEYRVGTTGNFSVLGSVGANPTGINIPNLAPGTLYNFRVRGFQGTAASPTAFTSYSTVASVTTNSTLIAPTGVSVASSAPTETSAVLTLTDNTALNTGYSIEYALQGSGNWAVLGTAGDNTSITMPNLLSPGTAYDFRVRAVYDNGTGTNLIYSGYSNTASYTTPFIAPTGLTATIQSETEIDLNWTDNSQAEGGYSVYYRPSGSGSYTLFNYAAANATSYAVTGLTPGTAYDFQVAAAFQRTAPGTSTVVESARSNTVTKTTKDGFTSPTFAPVTYGQTFSYQAAVTSTVSSRTSWSASGLPTGLNFDTGTGIISGTPTQSGLFTVTLTANYANGATTNETLQLRVVRPAAAPTVATPLPASQTFSTGDAAANLSLSTGFSDSDVESAVRLVTTKGNIDVLLYNAETPATVTNFMGYVNRGDYNNSAFHRISSIADSGVAVLQGGQFKPTSTGVDTFASITTQPAVQNEPGISNLNYTIAMAKQGGDPNSGTDQFYFNLTDADNVLDAASQNGGFTVFGRVSNSTKATLDAISSSPTGGPYTIKLDGTSTNQGFKWPMNVADQASVPATMDNSKIMTIISATPLTSLLTYSASTTNSNVATAAVSNSTLTITPGSAGTATITVTATDLDGLTATQTINVTVNQTLASWATQQGLTGGQSAPTADPDGDGLTNLQEFAFLTDPKTSNAAGSATSYALTAQGNASYGQITFPVRKFAAGITYTVEASDTMAAGSWTSIWTSTDGFNATVVVSAVDQSDRTVVTVRDTQPSPPATHRFFRVKVTSP